MEIQEEIKQIPTSPLLVITKNYQGCAQIFITVEQQILTECLSIPEAVVTLMATYFTFNMSYPGPLYPMYLFIQHHILGIKDEQTVPNIVTIMYNNTAITEN